MFCCFCSSREWCFSPKSPAQKESLRRSKDGSEAHDLQRQLGSALHAGILRNLMKHCRNAAKKTRRQEKKEVRTGLNSKGLHMFKKGFREPKSIRDRFSLFFAWGTMLLSEACFVHFSGAGHICCLTALPPGPSSPFGAPKTWGGRCRLRGDGGWKGCEKGAAGLARTLDVEQGKLIDASVHDVYSTFFDNML